jgi:hypothetical protein
VCRRAPTPHTIPSNRGGDNGSVQQVPAPPWSAQRLTCINTDQNAHDTRSATVNTGDFAHRRKSERARPGAGRGSVRSSSRFLLVLTPISSFWGLIQIKMFGYRDLRAALFTS